jgi:hypothetical protein
VVSSLLDLHKLDSTLHSIKWNSAMQIWNFLVDDWMVLGKLVFKDFTYMYIHVYASKYGTPIEATHPLGATILTNLILHYVRELLCKLWLLCFCSSWSDLKMTFLFLLLTCKIWFLFCSSSRSPDWTMLEIWTFQGSGTSISYINTCKKCFLQYCPKHVWLKLARWFLTKSRKMSTDGQTAHRKNHFQLKVWVINIFFNYWPRYWIYI